MKKHLVIIVALMFITGVLMACGINGIKDNESGRTSSNGSDITTTYSEKNGEGSDTAKPAGNITTSGKSDEPIITTTAADPEVMTDSTRESGDITTDISTGGSSGKITEPTAVTTPDPVTTTITPPTTTTTAKPVTTTKKPVTTTTTKPVTTTTTRPVTTQPDDEGWGPIIEL